MGMTLGMAAAFQRQTWVSVIEILALLSPVNQTMIRKDKIHSLEIPPNTLAIIRTQAIPCRSPMSPSLIPISSCMRKSIAAQLTTHHMSFGLFTRSLMYHHPGLRISLRPSYAITVTVLAMERLR